MIQPILSVVLELIPEAALMTTLGGDILLWNSGAEELYGYAKADASRMNLKQLIPPEEEGKYHQWIESAAAGNRIEGVETFRKTKDGRVVGVAVLMVAARDETGQVIGVFELSRSQKESWRKRTLENLTAPEQLLLTAAHDLRNPLSTMTNLMYLMEHRFEIKHLEMMRKQLLLCDLIINNLVAFSGARPMLREAVPITGLVDEVVGTVWLPHNIEVHITHGSSCSACIDPRQIRQVLMNLLQNAIEALQEHSGRIEVSTVEEGNFVRVNVADNGPGIVQAVRFNLFEPLVTTKEKGLGLGLAACKRMVEANGGRITYQSEQGAVTVFSVFVPKAVPTDSKLL